MGVKGLFDGDWADGVFAVGLEIILSEEYSDIPRSTLASHFLS